MIILVKAGAPVDATIDALLQYMEAGDVIIDGGNEWCVQECYCQSVCVFGLLLCQD